MPKKPQSPKELQEFYNREIICGFHAIYFSIQKAVKLFHLTPASAQYWREIVLKHRTSTHQHGEKRWTGDEEASEKRRTQEKTRRKQKVKKCKNSIYYYKCYKYI